MKQKLKILLLGLISFTIACNSNNEELEKAKKENERLKMEILQKEKAQKELEKQKLTDEVAELKNQLAEKEKNEIELEKTKVEKEKIEAENKRRKNVKINVKVDPLKKDGRKWDMSGGPDIFGTITINDTTINISSEENSSELIEEFNNVKIKIGDKIKINLWDKDFSSHDLICDGSILYSKNGMIKNKIESAEIEVEIK